MSDVGANIFAEWGGCTRVCCSVVCFLAWWAHLVRSLEYNGIRFRRVDGRLGRMMSCPMIMMTVVC